MHPYSVVSMGKYAYVANSLEDTISIVDLNLKKEIAKIMTGETPENLAIDYKNNQLVVTNWGSDSISIFDINTHQLIKEIKTGLQSRAFGSFIYP